MNLIPVPYGCKVSVGIRRENDNAYVEVHAPLYVKKLWDMPHCYSAEFTDGQILKDSDFIRVLTNSYGQQETTFGAQAYYETSRSDIVPDDEGDGPISTPAP